MSTQGNQPNNIPPTYGATGNVEGDIGEHRFQTSIADVSYANGVVTITAIHRDDDGTSEEVFMQFLTSIPLNEKQPLEDSKTVQIWVSLKTPSNPRALPYESGGLCVEELTLSPFTVKGYAYGTTLDPNRSLNIAFDLTL